METARHLQSRFCQRLQGDVANEVSSDADSSPSINLEPNTSGLQGEICRFTVGLAVDAPGTGDDSGKLLAGVRKYPAHSVFAGLERV